MTTDKDNKELTYSISAGGAAPQGQSSTGMMSYLTNTSNCIVFEPNN
jgi:hypothetical protein